jgi:copper transport protein
VTRGAFSALAVAFAAALLPASASAHAYIVRTAPASASILAVSPTAVRLTYDEAVEPRFASITVTDPAGHRVTTGPVTRSPSDPDTLVVPVRHLDRGWYLVVWRAISVDGHPVEGGFTFAVGPLPGNPPEFVPPHAAQSATTPKLVIARWLVFLFSLGAVGLFVFRMLLLRRLPAEAEARKRPVTIGFAVATALTLVAVPVYLDIASAVDSLQSVFDVGALVPLFDVTAFGRAWLDFELCFVLFAGAAAVALLVERPDRPSRSLAELIALGGALAAAAAALVVPGLAGHAAQTSPRLVSVLVDWVHLGAGSVWLGGLVGLLVLAASLPSGRRRAGLVAAALRFSPVAIGAVLLILATGVGASILHLPLLSALWQTSYGVAILVKAGLVLGALSFAALHRRGRRPWPAALAAEAVLVAGTVLAAAVLSSLPPPAAALAEESQSLASVGPGRVASTLHVRGYTLQVLVAPNTAIKPNSFALRITRNGSPVRGADVQLGFAMLDMEMGNEAYRLVETAPGVYTRAAPALVMAGRWALQFTITPHDGVPFNALVIDHATG